MIKLKQIIFYKNLDGAEVTWVDEIETITQIPDPTFIAPEDNPEAQAPLIDSVTKTELVVKCHSYAACQMDMLRADAAELGTSLAEYEDKVLAVEAAYIPPDPEPVQVPQVVTIRQAKLSLLQAGLLDDVDAAVAQTDRATQIEWEYATEVRRDWPTLLTLQAALGLSEQQVDDLFSGASTL